MSEQCFPSESVARGENAVPVLDVNELSVAVKGRTLLRRVTFAVRAGQIFGIIGPSGAGKSTLLRSLNRLTDMTPGMRVTGNVRLRGERIHGTSVDVNALRRRIGILFQQPVIFPGSVEDNVVFGVKRVRSIHHAARAELVEKSLRETALWEEVRDRLRSPAHALSVGQQQRLCLARALAVDPEVILMDEPTSALDPKSTLAIEELILRLKTRCTIVLVTHNVAQARRVTDWLACLCVRDGAGEIVESACCDALLETPQCREVMDYLAHTAGGLRG